MAVAPSAPVEIPCDTVESRCHAVTRSRVLRVLHVLPSFFGGGMEHLVARLICADPQETPGQEEGTPLTHGLCVLRDGDEQLLAACRQHAPTWVLGRPNRGRDRLAWWRLRRVIRVFRPDVVEALSTGVWLDAVLATRGLCRPRLVLSFHGRTDLAPLSATRRRLNAWCARRADAVVTVSRESAERLVREWGMPPSHMHTIPNGLDLDRYRPVASRDEQRQIRHELGLPVEPPLALCVANMVPIKALDVLMHAWRQVRMMHRSAELLVAGDGPLRDELQREATAVGCGSCVRFLGSRPDVDRLLRAADVFVLSSRYEACSIAVQEAMASGLPVVATDVGGTGELVAPAETGWLVPADRAEQLAERLQVALADEPMRRRMGRAARDIAVQRFGLDRCIEQYASLYAKLVQRGAASHDTDEIGSER